MMRWYVVQTQPQAETRALWHLQNQGFECFLPRIRKLIRHARKSEVKLVPLFPRYLFIYFCLDAVRWRSINGTRGVVSLLTNGDSPHPVPPGVLEALRSRCDEQGIAPLAALGILTKGLKVRIKNGAFAGHLAQISEICSGDSDRVRLLLTFLGVQTNLQLPAYAIEAA